MADQLELRGVADEAVTLKGEALNRFKNHLHDEARRAFTNKAYSEKKVRELRAMYELVPPTITKQTAEGGKVTEEDESLLVTPVLRGKVTGFKAKVKRQFRRKPLFSAVGKTSKDKGASSAMEMLMEKNLERTEGFAAYVEDAVHEASLTPACLILSWPVKDKKTGEYNAVDRRVINYENWACWPVQVKDFDHANVFMKYYETKHQIVYSANTGKYTNEIIDGRSGKLKMMPGATSGEAPSRVEDAALSRPNTNYFDSEVTQHLIYEFFFRWEGESWHGMYAYDDNIILRLVKYEYAEVLDGQWPCSPVYTERVPGRVYGVPIAAGAESYQRHTDKALNNHLEYSDRFNNPTTFINQDSQLFQRIQAGENITGLQYIPTPSDPRQDVYVLDMPDNNSHLKDLNLHKQLADAATFPDAALTGSPLTGIRSASEIGLISSSASDLIAAPIMTLAKCFKRQAHIEWMLLYEYVVKQNFIVEMGDPDEISHLLAYRDIPVEELQSMFVDFITSQHPEILQQIPEQEARAFLQQIASQVLTTPIYGGDKPDISWEINGTDLVPDKQARAQQAIQLANLLPLFKAAREYAPIYWLAKAIIENLDVPYADKMLPEQPPANMDIPDGLLENVSEIINNMKQGGAQGAIAVGAPTGA